MEQLNSKILLFGEYAVLHDGMALVIPCNKYYGKFEFSVPSENNKNATQSNEYLRKFCAFISSHMDEKFVLEVKKFEHELEQGLFFKSNIPQGYGLGSSGALVAAIVLRYLVKAKHLKDELKVVTFQKINELKKSLGNYESYFHGVSSGLDPLSSILNEPILYKGSHDIITTKLPEPSTEKNNVIFLLDTNVPRTTSKMMGMFNSLYSHEDFKEKFKQHIIQNNNTAIQNFLDNNTSDFYKSMYNLSSFQLQYMKDFFPESLQKEITKGLDNGDYFLKLCGAGGGGFVLGFTNNWQATQQKLKDYKLEEIYSY
ncbi:MAG: hypothetical protein LC122_03440 [Chitinophagales bacterium]|nr:hypothetical protein [Chitinophagales bacterium]